MQEQKDELEIQHEDVFLWRNIDEELEKTQDQNDDENEDELEENNPSKKKRHV